MPAVVGMPAHYEMLLSHSPPVYSHSPPSGYRSDYNRLCDHHSQTNSYCRSQMLSQQIHNRLSTYQQQQEPPPPYQQQTPIALVAPTVNIITGGINSSNTLATKNTNPVLFTEKKLTSPKRSCLVIKTESEVSEDQIDSYHPDRQRTKKKVVFADDHGRSLTEIRVMSEPSNVPPVWSLQFLAHVTQGLISPVPPEQWTITFRQPASDYLEFKKKLDTTNVSLENVIVKECESIVVGTIKVKNISFHKEVIVRTSCDNWISQEDTFCTYSQVGLASGTYVLYDTFSFKLVLPPQNRKIEFCICFRCDTKEYWDNNNNQNYIIYKRTMNNTDSSEILKKLDNCKIENSKSMVTNHSTTERFNDIIGSEKKFPDLTRAKVPQWSEFAFWTHLENSSPYW